MIVSCPRQILVPARLGFVVLFAISLTGCGGGTGEVSGVVKFKGEPLPSGRIAFVGTKEVASALIYNGNYTAYGVAVGAVKVTVQTVGSPKAKAGQAKSTLTLSEVPKGGMPPASALMPPGMLAELINKQQEAASSEGVAVAIPKRYSNPDQSGLVFNVTRGKQEFSVDLPP